MEKGLPVPEVFIRSEDNIYYLQEDLGDTLLFNAIGKKDARQAYSMKRRSNCSVRHARLLPAVQFAGADGMDFSYCYPQAEFNSRSILWDLNYFKHCFKATGMDFQEDRLKMISRKWQTCFPAVPQLSCIATSKAQRDD